MTQLDVDPLAPLNLAPVSMVSSTAPIPIQNVSSRFVAMARIFLMRVRVSVLAMDLTARRYHRIRPRRIMMKTLLDAMELVKDNNDFAAQAFSGSHTSCRVAHEFVLLCVGI